MKQFDIFPNWPTGEWPADTILRDQYVLPIDPLLPTAEYEVTVRLVDNEDGQPVGRDAKIGMVRMEAPERCFSIPSMSKRVEADFGDVLRLLGYDSNVQTTTASITLDWRTLRRMETSYEFFVHLVDVGSGELAAQVDVMPHDWSYPTAWWEVHEVVSDRIDIPLGEVSPGTYHLWIGVCAPDRGRRLEVVRGSSDLVADEGRLRLADTLRR